MFLFKQLMEEMLKTFSEEVSVDADYPWNAQRLGGSIDRRLLTEPSSQIKFLDMDKDGDMDLIGSNVGTQYSGKQAINVLAFQNDIFEPKQGYMEVIQRLKLLTLITMEMKI